MERVQAADGVVFQVVIPCQMASVILVACAERSGRWPMTRRVQSWSVDGVEDDLVVEVVSDLTELDPPFEACV